LRLEIGEKAIRHKMQWIPTKRYYWSVIKLNLLNDKDLARKIEDIKLQGTKGYINQRRKMSPPYNGDFVSFKGKGDVFYMNDYCFGIGFGLNGDVLTSDIEAAEDFARRNANCSTVHFELSPFCNQSLLAILQERGYTLDHFLAVWILYLDDWGPTKDRSKIGDVSLVKVTANESYEWARTVALGFSSDSHTTEESIESVRCFLNLPNSAAFLLKEKEKGVAGGNLAITDKLGEMFLTSTLESHRGKGYQNLLIEERIRFAKSKGCTHMTVTTKPNTSSARNMEKNGFKLIYNKAIMKSPQ
jgi:GNAT superfamily N-acetyltransferase